MTLRSRGLLVAAAVAACLLAAAGISWRLASRTEIPVGEARLGAFIRLVTAEGTLRAVRATQITAPIEAREAFQIAWMAPDRSRVRKGEIVVRFDPTGFRNNLLEGKGDLSVADNKLEKSNAQSAATRENLGRDAQMATRELDAARTFEKKDAEIFSHNQIIESEIDRDLAARRRDHSESARSVRESLSRAEQELLSIERRKAEMKITQARQGLGALEVRAPHDGILVFRRDWRGEISRVGDTVWGGQPLAEIPDTSKMEAEIFVLEADAGGLAPGMQARVVVESNPDLSYEARVARVDTVAKPRLRNVPVQYFGVTLKLSRTDPAVMKPGARVQATLEIEKRDRALWIPLQAVFEKDGRKIAYRRRGEAFEAVPIRVGPNSLGRIVIEDGLSPGDRLALRDPSRPREEKPPQGSGSDAVPASGGGPS